MHPDGSRIARRLEALGPARRRLHLLALVVPGLAYVAWPFIGVRGQVDPPGLWIGLGVCVLGVAALDLRRSLDEEVLKRVLLVLGVTVSLHLFLLASLNEEHSLYAGGSWVSLVATALFIGSPRSMIAYALLVFCLGGALFVLDPEVLQLVQWVSALPVLALAHQRLRMQLAQHADLEAQVEARTDGLRDANQRWLEREILERRRIEDELRSTEKMGEEERLAGGVAHDFNNLLTTIGVYAELVLEGLPADCPQRHEVLQIQKANHQAAALTHQLLTLRKRSAVEFDFIDLNGVISGARSMLRQLLREDTELELDLAAEPQPIWGNLDQLQQVVINLALNARHAMSGPGVFALSTTRCTSEHLVEHGLVGVPVAREYVRLEARDTGCGMNASVRDRVFDPFFTTKERGEGTGLGLSIVHGILDAADGFVRVESEPLRGARFELYWPLAIPEATVVSKPFESRALGRREEILLVEDGADLRHALVRVLTNAGYSVTSAESGSQALEITERRGHTFDLVVSDVVMPNMSGFELAERLALTHPEARVLLVSGHLGEGSLDPVSSGVAFLAKPFSAAEFSERVRELLDEPA